MTDADPNERGRHREPERDERTGTSAAAARIQHQAQWVELQLQRARDRGEFDDLPGYGKPIRDLGSDHDPDWWLKRLVEREKISVPPPALALRKEDAELDARLDDVGSAEEVRRQVALFNENVRKVLYTNHGGPPVTTPQRDIDAEVAAWRERRDVRRAHAAAERAARTAEPPARKPRRRWFRRSG